MLQYCVQRRRAFDPDSIVGTRSDKPTLTAIVLVV